MKSVLFVSVDEIADNLVCRVQVLRMSQALV